MVLPATQAGDGTFETAVSLASYGVTHGDELTATYQDSSAAEGLPAAVQDVAALDCEGPELTELAIGPVYSTLAVVSFKTSEVVSGRVEYGSACDARTSTASSANPGTNHIIGITGLTPDTTYRLAVAAIDALGNETLVLDGGDCFEIHTPATVDRLTERFTSGNDLAFSRITFVPVDSPASYEACVEPVTALSSNPAGGTALILNDDTFEPVDLLEGQTIPFFGVAYDRLFVSSNGVITFTEGDISHQETLTVHFSSPRVSLWHDDFLPDSNSTISWKQLANRFVVTYENLAEINTSNSNTMQAEFFFDGRIRLTYLQMGSQDGIAGLSGTDTYPLDFVSSDLSNYPVCPATEGEEEDPIYFADPALEGAIRAAWASQWPRFFPAT
ncbi:MAG: hypothetical protein HC888_04855 [Candidatus Competibacteraceae bacterium]|nr:hypothetical protein [Candidatus Competibacteraceae bacterium]